MTDREAFRRILYMIATDHPRAYQELKISNVHNHLIDMEDVKLLLSIMDRLEELDHS